MVSVPEAFAVVISSVMPAKTQTIPLREAVGRALAESIHADRDYPPIDRATMDGIAIHRQSRKAGLREWKMETTLAAGVPAPALRAPAGGCVQIMTGAEVPCGCDAVIPYEQLDIAAQSATLKSGVIVSEGQNIHARSLDRRKGDLILSPGVVLDAPRMAILAAVGKSPVKVHRRPRVSILSTGNEIVPVEQPEIATTQTRASNLHALAAGLRLIGIDPVRAEHLRDDQPIITSAIGSALRDCDVLLITGGISKGKYDFVNQALTDNNVPCAFHGVAQKPGKPLWFGHTSSCHVFGLPGNPVSTLTIFRRYVIPYLQISMGLPVPPSPLYAAPNTIRSHPELTLFLPVRLVSGQTGPTVELLTYHGSGDFAALAGSDGFIEVSPVALSTGQNVNYPFYSWRY